MCAHTSNESSRVRDRRKTRPLSPSEKGLHRSGLRGHACRSCRSDVKWGDDRKTEKNLVTIFIILSLAYFPTPLSHKMDEQDKIEMAKEEAMIRAYIAANPWPTKEEMHERFEKHPSGMDMFAEYGEFNHEALKTIYESNIDKTIAHELGLRIAKRGGIRALCYNCMAFMRCSPLASPYSRNMVIAANARMLEFAWSGISSHGQTFRA